MRVSYREYYHNPYAYGGHYVQSKHTNPIMIVPYYNSTYEPYHMVIVNLKREMNESPNRILVASVHVDVGHILPDHIQFF